MSSLTRISYALELAVFLLVRQIPVLELDVRIRGQGRKFIFSIGLALYGSSTTNNT